MSTQSGGSVRLFSFTLILDLPHSSPTIDMMTLIFKASQAQNTPGLHSPLNISTRRAHAYPSSLTASAHLAQMPHIPSIHDHPSYQPHHMHPTSPKHVRPAASLLLPPLLPPPPQISITIVIERLNQLFRHDRVCTHFSAREAAMLLLQGGLHILHRMALVLLLLRMRRHSAMLFLNRVGVSLGLEGDVGSGVQDDDLFLRAQAWSCSALDDCCASDIRGNLEVSCTPHSCLLLAAHPEHLHRRASIARWYEPSAG
jgi:hypothetical protein